MKVSELMDILANVWEEHGDIDVTCIDRNQPYHTKVYSAVVKDDVPYIIQDVIKRHSYSTYKKHLIIT